MRRLASDGIQQVREDPLVDLATVARRQVHETNAALSRGAGPTNLTICFHAQARESQLKAQADALLRAQSSHGLHGYALVIEVADDSAVTIVEGDVGQRAQFMPVPSACVPRGKRDCLHTLPRNGRIGPLWSNSSFSRTRAGSNSV